MVQGIYRILADKILISADKIFGGQKFLADKISVSKPDFRHLLSDRVSKKNLISTILVFWKTVKAPLRTFLVHQFYQNILKISCKFDIG